METIGIILVAISGVAIGKALSALKKPYWILGYLCPLLLIIIIAIARFSGVLSFVPHLFWLITGRTKFVILALTVTIGLTTPLSRLPRKCEKVIICLLMTIVVIWFSVLPFLVPALIKNRLLNSKTIIDLNGLCFQTTDYTCGPAAAVTALGKLGLQAEEGELAVLAHSSPIAGTLPHSLYTALKNRYEKQGLKCSYQYFDSIDQLKNDGITLVALSDSFLVDHCVAVLEVSDKMVTIADPVSGRTRLTRKRFRKLWRSAGIVLQRDTTQSI